MLNTRRIPMMLRNHHLNLIPRLPERLMQHPPHKRRPNYTNITRHVRHRHKRNQVRPLNALSNLIRITIRITIRRHTASKHHRRQFLQPLTHRHLPRRQSRNHESNRPPPHHLKLRPPRRRPTTTDTTRHNTGLRMKPPLDQHRYSITSPRANNFTPTRTHRRRGRLRQPMIQRSPLRRSLRLLK